MNDHKKADIRRDRREGMGFYELTKKYGGDRLPREMTRLARMMEHCSGLADEPPRDCPDGPLEATFTIDGEDRKTVYFFGAPPATDEGGETPAEPERPT